MGDLFQLVNGGDWNIRKPASNVDYVIMFCPETHEFLITGGVESSKSVSLTLLLVLEYILISLI